ncbi:MAG: hypothetical protein ACTSWQ_02350 [Candidatus Thorarchaeota archaeon]
MSNEAFSYVQLLLFSMIIVVLTLSFGQGWVIGTQCTSVFLLTMVMIAIGGIRK